MTSVTKRRTELEARRAQLLERLEGIEAELDSHTAKDWEESATEHEDDEVLEGIGLSGQQELRMIDAALQRVEAGEYGICVKCGAEIGEDRLAVLPYTPFCRSCAS